MVLPFRRSGHGDHLWRGVEAGHDRGARVGGGVWGNLVAVVAGLMLKTGPWDWALAASIGVLLAGLVQLPWWRLAAVGAVLCVVAGAGWGVDRYRAAQVTAAQQAQTQAQSYELNQMSRPTRALPVLLRAVGRNDPTPVCSGLMSEAARASFATAAGAPDCPAAVRALAAAGVPTYVSIAPVIPAITDHEIEHILEAAAHAGAKAAFFIPVRLPWEVAPLFKQWLEVHYPQRADRIMARIHDMRGGKDYDADFATRMKGSGLWAELIRQRFEKATARIGFNRERTTLDASGFQRPRLDGQGALF